MTASTNGVGVVPGVLQTPVGPYLSSFSTSLRKQGYSTDSVLRKTRAAAHLCLWLERRCFRLRDLPVHVEQFLRYRTRRHMLHRGDVAALRAFSDFLCDQGIIRAQEFDSAKLDPVEKCVKEYERYLREDRVLARETIIKYVYFSRIFLKERFGRGQVTLSKLSASDVVEFLRTKYRNIRRRPSPSSPRCDPSCATPGIAARRRATWGPPFRPLPTGG